MRNLLIVLVLGVTALTFYSALWFKSENIEDDITARVTDDLVSSGAQNIEIGVDGRHVTLTGVVYDEAAESAYLDTADNTYGALGPIDGLTFQADGGYINAVKTSQGITLRGTVPNEDVRAMLIGEAQAATDGAIDDQLIVSGPEADWQGEAGFGLGQLANLTTGNLVVSPGAYSLSGNTDGSPQGDAVAALDRDGWSTFISSPTETQDLSAEVDRLTVGIANRDARIGRLETAVSDSQGETETLTRERDAIGDELANLRAGLTETEADAADLRGQFEAANAMIAEKDQTIDDLTGQLSEGSAQISALETELLNRQAALGSTDEQVTALRAELDTANDVIADLTSQVSDRGDAIAGLTSDLVERDATIGTLNDQIAGFSASADQSVADLAQELATRDGTIADLTGTIAERDQEIGTLTSTVAERDTQIETLTGAVAERDATIAGLSTEVSDLDGSVASSVAQIAALTAATQTSDATVADLEGQVTNLEGQVTDLTETVAVRDETIASLRARPVTTLSSADQCTAQATEALEGSQINFETSSAQIASGSVEFLERLTGIALACVSDDLTVEIGGHTDAQGAEADNQALSEARAQAVVAFMVARGVPANGLRAVGFGESRPIADNDTSEGRAQNRRISFDWQAR